MGNDRDLNRTRRQLMKAALTEVRSQGLRRSQDRCHRAQGGVSTSG